jgi:hypothetical protein
VTLLILLARILTGAIGLLFIYGALFLYETEHRILQSRLEELWLRIDDLQSRAVRRHVAFLRVAALAASRFLDRLIGPSGVSFRVISVTACLSVASMIVVSPLVRSLLLPFIQGVRSTSSLPRLVCVLIERAFGAGLCGDVLSLLIQPYGLARIAIAATALLSVTAQFLLPRLRFLPMVVVATFTGLISVAFPDRQWLVEALATMILGVACDLIAFAVLRYCLTRQAYARSMVAILAMTLGEVMLGGFLLIAPLAAMNLIGVDSDSQISMSVGSAIAFTSNGAAVALTFALIVAAITLALHRLLWPMIARPLYLLADLRIFATRQRRATTLGVGIVLITIAVHKTGSVAAALQALLGAT